MEVGKDQLASLVANMDAIQNAIGARERRTGFVLG